MLFGRVSHVGPNPSEGVKVGTRSSCPEVCGLAEQAKCTPAL